MRGWSGSLCETDFERKLRMAELQVRMRADLTAAMKAKDSFLVSVLRMALTAIHTEEVSGDTARVLTQEEELVVITREVRKRRESAEVYVQGNRAELAQKEEKEAELLGAYLPAPPTEAEIDQIIAEEIAAVQGATMKQMGQIIKAVHARTQGQADGSLIAGKVRAALSV